MPSEQSGTAIEREKPEDVCPKTLVRIVLFEPDSTDVELVAYEAQQPQGTLRTGDDYRTDAIGFAELPKHTTVGRFEDFDAFRGHIERHATYVHWKPVIDDAD